ncbi:hypothetical protein RHGRI_037257 [Rhododendron griersonianum]|uniref:Senescence regulator n=2 Tax=Rhododendron TaxID=4346 RepID=A0AAV6HWI4_9ERIC
MAKGRKLTTSRSERYLGSYDYRDRHHHGHGTVAAEATELGEEDVWSTVDDMVNGGGDDDDRSMDSRGEWSPRSSTESDGSRGQLRQVGGLSLAFEDTGKTSSPRVVHQFRGQDSVSSRPRARHVATSAPVNVPDWSKIYRVDSVESLHDSDEGFDDRESEMVPPHEFLAREHRKRSENSVFEGVGRTLKGRDLRRVRDAVWSQTGFNG